MPRYLVERSFPEGLAIPVDDQGAKTCQVVVDGNAAEGVTWLHSYVTPDKQMTFADTTVRRLLARERFSIPGLPNETPSQLTSPTPTATEPSGRPGWLIPALGGLAAILAHVVGITVLVVRHTNGRQRAGQTV
jgi:hypothetical protein